IPGQQERGEKQDFGRCSCSIRHPIGRTKVSQNYRCCSIINYEVFLWGNQLGS
uniref:Uncharacterized protein n=1 Tax=Aegilops tauschii subsp. strangulata TaxID=200361 RepID=A0A452ZBC2_AEGTS